MKRVKIKNIVKPVRCSFCKTNETEHMIQGYPYGGRTVCIPCFDELQKKSSACEKDYDSFGEEQVYSMYGV